MPADDAPSPATKAVGFLASRMILTETTNEQIGLPGTMGFNHIMTYLEKNFADLPKGPDRDYLLQVLDLHRMLQAAVDEEEAG